MIKQTKNIDFFARSEHCGEFLRALSVLILIFSLRSVRHTFSYWGNFLLSLGALVLSSLVEGEGDFLSFFSSGYTEGGGGEWF